MIIAYLPAGARANSASRKWKALPAHSKLAARSHPVLWIVNNNSSMATRPLANVVPDLIPGGVLGGAACL